MEKGGLARMRIGCSNKDNPTCSCHHAMEDATRRMLHCSLYNDAYRNLLNTVEWKLPISVNKPIIWKLKFQSGYKQISNLCFPSIYNRF